MMCFVDTDFSSSTKSSLAETEKKLWTILGFTEWSENVFTFQGCHESDDESEFLLHSALVKVASILVVAAEFFFLFLFRFYHGSKFTRSAFQDLFTGHRAYEGHKKLITPNKRKMLPYFLNKTMTETESEKMMKKFHSQSLGQREIRVSRAGSDVTKYPVPE
ncbi:hypothetical protein DY000_02020950, partial [Brassica cretica]